MGKLKLILLFVLGFTAGLMAFRFLADPKIVNPSLLSDYFSKATKIQPSARIYEEYSIENLKNWPYRASNIDLGPLINKEKGFNAYEFSFLSDGKKVSGQANLPVGDKKYPVVLMIRGYIDRENYKIGDGTRKAAAFFAQSGFITLAPDFLGFGKSDPAGDDTLKARFETYITTINLIKSLTFLPQGDSDHLFIWSHSNGGQIALTVLEITGLTIPVSLWAPVSRPFPYSILYYSHEASDAGKLLRKTMANFEKDNDVDFYSLTNFLNLLNSPLLLRQGTADEIVPPSWSRDLFKSLKTLGKEVKYVEYLGEDHNFSKGSWLKAVSDDLEFYRRYLKVWYN